MATLTKQTAVKGGLNASFVAAAGGGDEFPNDGKTLFIVKNGSGGTIVVTLVTQATTDGLAVADRTVSVGAGEDHYIADLDPNVYNDTSGNVQATYDGVTSLTVAALELAGV